MPASKGDKAQLPWRVSEKGSKVEAVASRCFYMIAMGKWPPGMRLPAVRQVESEWLVNRLTVLKAYGILAEHGLVKHEPNGSFYVAEQAPRRDFSRDRIVLHNLYEMVVHTIEGETDLLPLEVLRMLARIGESKAREDPEVAFVECSRSQAADHAREITARLDVPVLPLTLDDIRGGKMSIPSRVKVVLTTSFHVDELTGLRDSGVEVVALPIEMSPEVMAEISEAGDIVFLESSDDLARRTCKDAFYMMGVAEPRVKVVRDTAAFLKNARRRSEGFAGGTLFLVSQKIWEGLEPGLREHSMIRPISCRLGDGAWQLVVNALKMPFGVAV